MYPPHYPLYPYLTVNQSYNSSPVWSEIDPVKLLRFFFKWLMDQLGFNNEQQREIFKPIKVRLIEEVWNINTLKALKRKGEGITNEIQEEYDFKIGILARIRGKIFAFKLLRQQIDSNYISYVSIMRLRVSSY